MVLYLVVVCLRGYIPFFSSKKRKNFILLYPKVYPIENIFPNFHRDLNNSSTMTCKFVCFECDYLKVVFFQKCLCCYRDCTRTI